MLAVENHADADVDTSSSGHHGQGSITVPVRLPNWDGMLLGGLWQGGMGLVLVGAQL